MMSMVQPYIDALLQQQTSSWTIVSILYLLAAISIRGWFWAPLSSHMKQLDKKVVHKLKSIYLKKSLLGWLFFLFPLVIIIVYWNRNHIPLPLTDTMLVIAGITSYVLSLLFHLQAFGIAAVSASQAVEVQKQLRDI